LVNPAEIANMVLAGATVAAGRATAVVCATGAQTEFGQVAHLTTITKREPSTLEIQVARIVRIVTAIAISMGTIVFLLSYLLIGLHVTESFIFAIGIIVALVPEGLLPTVTLSLALGVQRMAKQNALVRRLSAVETLSAVSTIFTDKTGTLTKNEMTVRYLWLPAAEGQLQTNLVEVSGAGYDPTAGQVQMPADYTVSWKIRLLLIGASLCSNARLIHPSPSRWQEIGDPTEAALLVVAIRLFGWALGWNGCWCS
jgi:magnesium-transporting ATPase (P-type)